MTIPTPQSWARVKTMGYVFFDLSQRSYIEHLRLGQQLRSKEWPEYSEELLELESVHGYTGIQTIVFSAMCIEATIFDFAAIHLGDEYVRDHLDKLDLLSKWVVVLRFVCGHELETGKEPYASIKRLVSARNALVHSKSEKLDFDNMVKQITRVQKESDELAKDVHNAFRALVLLSIDIECALGRATNPLPSFNPRKEYDETLPPEIKPCADSCRRIILSKRAKKGSQSMV